MNVFLMRTFLGGTVSHGLRLPFPLALTANQL
jgi:hypothetical protein